QLQAASQHLKPVPCVLEVILQVFDASIPGAPGINLFRREAGKHDDFFPRPGDGNIQTAVTTIPVQGSEVDRNTAGAVGTVRKGDEDDIPLVSLYVFQILDEDRLRMVRRKIRLDGRFRLAQFVDEILNEPLLRLVESDDADGWHSASRSPMMEESAANFFHDGFCLNAVRVRPPSIVDTVY